MDVVIQGMGDELGPEQIILLQQPQVGLEAVVVVDNTACGPAIGGVRMAPDMTVEEVALVGFQGLILKCRPKISTYS